MGDFTFSSATPLVACSVVGIKSGRGQKYPILSLEREEEGGGRLTSLQLPN